MIRVSHNFLMILALLTCCVIWTIFLGVAWVWRRLLISLRGGQCRHGARYDDCDQCWDARA